MNTSFNLIQVKLIDALNNIAPIYEKLMENRKIPEAVRMECIQSNHFKDILSIHQELIVINESELTLRLKNESNTVNYCHKLSTVFYFNNNLIGTCLVLNNTIDKSAYLYGLIIRPNYRRTWATVYVKYHSLEHLHNSGFVSIAFMAHENNADTLKHAQKIGYQRVKDEFLWNY